MKNYVTEMISLNNITKRYKSKTLYKNVSFDIKSNEIYGLIGPNGSGKTTLFKLILNLKQLTSGEILYNIDNIFYLDDKYTLPGSSLEEIFKYMRIYDLEWNENIFVDYLKRYNLIDIYLVSASKGQRALIALFLAIASSASLILIDEIFDGLDELKRNEIITIITETRGVERSYIVIDHNLARLEEICTNFILIKNYDFEEITKYSFDRNKIYEYYN